jgi:hypothetical protein
LVGSIDLQWRHKAKLHPKNTGALMAEQIFEPIPISYTGLFADSHLVDAQQYGKSIIGVSKLANSVCHLFFFAAITHDPRSYQIHFYVGPSKKNGLLQEMFAVMNSGLMPMFTPILTKVAKEFIEKTIDAVVKTTINRKSDARAAVESIHDLASQHNEFAKQVHDGHLRDKAWLQDMVQRLASENRTSLREIPEPIGKSVRQLRIGSQQSGAIIDEPAAEVLKAKDSMSVGDARLYNVRLEGVFKTNGACKVRLIDEDKVVSGKITDPAVANPGNIYTTALNEGATLQVTAKPTVKGGSLHRLFISDAKAPKQK